MSDPERLGDLELGPVVGQGGMGVVHRARHLGLDRTVAVKLIAPALAADPAFRERFRREARLLGRIDHPNVLPVFDAGEAGGRLFLVTRWVEGADLAAVLRGPGAGGVAVGRALDLAGQVAAGLDAIHAAGLVHRDVKPANVLLEARAEGEHAWLADLGAGRELDDAREVTQAGDWIGTVDYLAPEVVEGEGSGPPADRYALACLLFELLTGAPPFRRPTPAGTIAAQVADAVPAASERRPTLPGALDGVLARGLAKDPEERYPTARALVEAARAAVGVAAGDAAATVVPGAGPPASPPPQAEPARSRRRDLLLAGAGLLAAALVAALLVVLLGGSDDDGGSARPARRATASAPRIAVTKIPLGKTARAGSVVADGQAVFVGDDDPKHPGLVFVDPTSGTIGGRIELPSVADGLRIDRDRDRLWVGTHDGHLRSYSLTSGDRVGKVIDLDGVRPQDLIPQDDPDRLIVAQHDPGVLLRVDLRRERVVGRPREVGASLSAAIEDVGAGALVIGVFPTTVFRFDASLEQTGSFPVPEAFVPSDMLASPRGELWVSDYTRRQLLRLDPSNGRLVARPVRTGKAPFALAFDADHGWEVDKGDSTVVRRDIATGAAVGTPTKLGPLAGPLAPRQDLRGGVWVPGARELYELEPQVTP